jgi:aubergine-like protein
LDFDKNPMSTFQRRDGEITYVDYYKMEYGIDIRDHRQPLLVSLSKSKLPGGPVSTKLVDF